jgi:hypothetical protein
LDQDTDPTGSTTLPKYMGYRQEIADKGEGEGLNNETRKEKELTLTQGKPCCLVQASITAATPSCEPQAVSSASHRFSVLVLEPPYRFKYLGTNRQMG